MKILGALILLVLLFACSKVGVGYSLGTRQIKSKVDDAFDFSPRSKSKEVDKFLSAEFAKNKKVFFVKLKEQLHKVEAITAKDQITPAEGEELHKDAANFQKEMILLFKPSFDKVLREVNDAEMKVFKEYSSEQITEKEEEAADKKAFKKKKLANIVRIAEFFLDDLSKDQQKLTEKFFDDHLNFYTEQIQMRKNFNAELIKLYPQKDKMIDLSLAYYSGDNSIRTDTYIKQREIFENDLKNFILEMWKLRSPEQKTFFQKRLKDIIHEVDKILAE
ncbi:hypothetical protein CIK05_09365 [Bdellovibrio sp. qaytius]|nr:hypothetical protein CIK05_09365 [Bdellovibrio sp. qaytius]